VPETSRGTEAAPAAIGSPSFGPRMQVTRAISTPRGHTAAHNLPPSGMGFCMPRGRALRESGLARRAAGPLSVSDAALRARTGEVLSRGKLKPMSMSRLIFLTGILAIAMFPASTLAGTDRPPTAEERERIEAALRSAGFQM
jgi:hypothetical protein